MVRVFPAFPSRMGQKRQNGQKAAGGVQAFPSKGRLEKLPSAFVFSRAKAERTVVRSAEKPGIYLIVSSSSPALTDWLGLTKTSSIVPSMRATTLVSIFMASITASTSLTLT